ncbi:unnamed protein product [Arabidopsis halleri]
MPLKKKCQRSKSCSYLQKNLSLFTVLPLISANSNKSVEKICH